MHFPRRFAGVRRIFIVGIVTALAMTLAAPGASAARDPLSDAQSRITAAQAAADKAAAAYDDAQTRYFTLQHDAQLTRSDIVAIRATRQALANTVIERAVALYMRAGETGFDDVFNSGSNVLDAARRSTLGAAANAHDDAAIGRLRALTEDLDVRQASLRSQLADAKTALDAVRSEQESLQRSLDDARRAEEELRVRLEREQRANEYAARVQRARAAASPGSSSGSAPDGSNDPAQIIVSGDWVCPVQGAVSFTSSFGEPRNGHTHQGVDMFASTGTPLVAVVAGSMFFQSDTLGGLAAYVTGSDGTTYYYAHLNDYVGGNRSVSAGELIGHVGNTGDASGGASHLHFEIRPGGPNGSAIDPYPTLIAHC